MWILLERVIQGHFKVHVPYSEMIKYPFTCQPKFDMWAKIEEERHQDHQNQAKLRKKRSEERRLTGPSSKEPEEQTHLERTILNSLHQRMKHHGRGQSRASNGKGKYLGRWLSHPHSMLCTN